MSLTKFHVDNMQTCSVFSTTKPEDALQKDEVGDTLQTDSQECQFPHLKQELTWKLLI